MISPAARLSIVLISLLSLTGFALPALSETATVASPDGRIEITVSDEILKRSADAYRRIRNTLRFLLGALDSFTKSEMVDLSKPEDLPELEQLVLHQLYELDQKIRSCIKNYEYGKMAKELHEFCNQNLSAFYFDIRKDRLYCDDPQSFERRATRTVMAQTFDCLVTWLAPILSFTCEEAWSHRPAGVFEEADSIHLRDFPKVSEKWKNSDLAAKWIRINEIREIVNNFIEHKRANNTLGSSLEACIKLKFWDFDYDFFNSVDWSEVCIISSHSLSSENIPKDNVIWPKDRLEVEKAPGKKCVRCWKILPEVADSADDLCHRCDSVVNKKQAA